MTGARPPITGFTDTSVEPLELIMITTLNSHFSYVAVLSVLRRTHCVKFDCSVTQLSFFMTACFQHFKENTHLSLVLVFQLIALSFQANYTFHSR